MNGPPTAGAPGGRRQGRVGVEPGGIIDRVLTEVSHGGTPASIAVRIGLPVDLVDGVLGELVYAGLVERRTSTCATADSCTVAQLARDERPVRCAGCPLTR